MSRFEEHPAYRLACVARDEQDAFVARLRTAYLAGPTPEGLRRFVAARARGDELHAGARRHRAAARPMRITNLLSLLMVFLISTMACASWRPRDRVLGVTATLAIGADIGSTVGALRDPVVVELNPFLGGHPAPARVVVLGSLGAALTLAIGELLPQRARPWWLGGIATICLATTIHNVRQ